MNGIKLSVVLSLGMALLAIFLFIVSPNVSTQKASLLNLLIFGSIGSFVSLYLLRSDTYSKNFVEAKDKKMFFKELTLGVFVSFLSLVLINAVIKGFSGFYNLLGFASVSNVNLIGFEEALFQVIFQPISETFILIGAYLLVFNFLRKSQNNFISIAASVLIVSIFFSALHFAALGKENYEYSVNGFLNFITDTNGFGTGSYTGAFPQLIMGIIWLLAAVYYRSFLVPLIAHLVLNLFVLINVPNLSGSLAIIASAGMFLTLGLIVFSFSKKYISLNDLVVN